ncbi:thiamine pyrophosphate-dependent enzyme [Thermodesulfobacteriota bacterium]
MTTIKELSHRKEKLAGGHRLCAGCGASIVVRQAFLAADDPVVLSNATGCLEVATSIYPFTSWKVPWIHSAFENSAATISGVEAMYQSLKKQGKISADKKIKFIAYGGDGGTYDIGLQSLSGALERGHDFVYICYDNGAYMNTGIQRSSSTPLGANTTTTPVGKVLQGREGKRKDLTMIAMAHDIPYAAQGSPAYWKDLNMKVRKALNTEGPCFLNVVAPCHRGWRSKPEETVLLSKLAVTTNFWPLYEFEDGKVKINYRPKERKPIQEWLERQGRFKHLFKPMNAHIIEEFQRQVDSNWDRLNRLEKLYADDV